MPLNLLKSYNELLDILSLNDWERIKSLKSIFNRDIRENRRFSFHNKPIFPTARGDGETAMENLFNHLTRSMVDKKLRNREFDHARSVRLHWIRFHVEERKQENMFCFSVKEPDGTRTYVYDKDEAYVIVLQPLRDGTAYYLLTAYPLMGKDAARDKMMKKYKRKLPDVL
jgi:hypothetical protein